MSIRTFITDASHYLGDGSEKGLAFVNFLRSVSHAGSLRIGEKAQISPLRCIQCPNRKRCQGRTIIARFDESIQWCCTDCKTNGFISGWRATPWDLSPFASRCANTLVIPALSQVEYAALSRVPLSSFECEVILASAVWQNGRVMIAGGYEELDQLSESIAGEANQTMDRHLRRDLDGLFELLNIVLGHAV